MARVDRTSRMNTALWIHLIVFLGVFILVSVVSLRKESKANRDSFAQIQVEEFDAEKLEREARLGIKIARKAQKEVEDVKRETKKKLEELESKIQAAERKKNSR